MAATKLFLVVKQDTVIQATTYLVRAADTDDALEYVEAGMYIEETKPETLDTLGTVTVSVEEVQPEGKGQER